MRKLLTILILTILVTSMGIALASEKTESTPPKASPTKALASAINQTKANMIAIENAKATYKESFIVKMSELKQEHGMTVWKIKLESATHLVEMLVDANTGAIVSSEKKSEEYLKFSTSGDDLTGMFVSFTFNESDRKISKYSFNNTTVFTSIDIGSFSELKKRLVEGAVVKIEGDKDVKIDMHDNPTGLLKIEAAKGTVTLNVKSGIRINRTSNTTVKLNTSGFEGILMIAGASKDADSISVSGNLITVKLEHGKLMFRAKPAGNYGDRDNLAKLESEIEKGHVGGELHVKGRKSFDVVIYKDVVLNITKMETVNKTINVSVSSATSDGKFIVINIDREVLETSQSIYTDLAGGYKILLDGKPIPQAGNMQDLINAKAKNETSKYIITNGASGAQIIIYMQKFSEHTITIKGVAPVIPGVPGFEALSLAVAFACLALLRKRR